VDQIAQVKPALSAPGALMPGGLPSKEPTRVARPSVRQAMDAGAGDGRLPKADRVHLALKRAIVRGELAPGAALDKPGLCLRFGVSRLPVTTAIHRLAYEGLVRIEPQRGSYVSRIRLDDVLQWMMARQAIEAEVAAEAARRLSAERLESLEHNLRYQAAAVAGDDFDGFLDLDVVFHDVLVEGLGLDRIAETLDALRVHLDRVRRLLLPEPGRMAATLAEHRAIHEAIAARKPAAASRTMRRHLDVVARGLVAFERDHPDFFGS
jgi:GntR family transcriptional regulator, rspAB operon transcriptional repressor